MPFSLKEKTLKMSSEKSSVLKIFLSSATLVSVIFSAPAFSNVATKNGNFFIGYLHCSFTGGIDARVETVYNSKSSHDGRFGFGWGSDYETVLKDSPDGSVVVYENGGGAQNRFTPATISADNAKKASEMILAAKKKSGVPLNASQADEELKRLTTDARYRNDEWDKLRNRGLVQAQPLPEGTVLRSNRFSYQTVTKQKDNKKQDIWVRRFDAGQVQTFDSAGRLSRLADKNGNFLNMTYNKSGQMVHLQDNQNNTIKLTYGASGKVEKAECGNKVAIFKYKGNELVYTKDSEGNVYEFKYSSNGRHNLVEIAYSDKTTLQVGYNPVNEGETVKWVKDRDGSLTEYKYGGDSVSGYSYFTEIISKGSDGKEISKVKYEYTEKAKADGERYTYKLVSTVDGDKTETIYNECCGLPLEITKNGEKTSFEYDVKGHVTKKITPTEVSQLEYHPTHNKVTKVTKMSKVDKTKAGVNWAQYQYDDKGNLSFAKNSQGKGVRIVYDHLGRIKAMVDQDKRRLEFTYNQLSRPVEIRDPSVGKIQVQYSDTGEILKVDSTGGRKIALQVTSAFQNLLEIIRPAGVTLSF